MSTLTMELNTNAKMGLMDFQRSYSIHNKMDKYIGQWKAVNLILESCADDNIVNMINEYHDKKKVE